MFTSDFHVELLPGGQLQIIASGVPWTALPLLFLSICGALFVLYNAYAKRDPRKLGNLIIWSLPPLVIGLILARDQKFTFDRVDQVATFYRPVLFGHDTSIIPLDTIEYAELRSSGSSPWIALIMRNTNVGSLTAPRGPAGQREAVTAINNYLGVARR